MLKYAAEETQFEIIPEDERHKLEDFGAQLAALNLQVKTMQGVRRGIVERAFAAASRKLEKERYAEGR